MVVCSEGQTLVESGFTVSVKVFLGPQSLSVPFTHVVSAITMTSFLLELCDAVVFVLF